MTTRLIDMTDDDLTALVATAVKDAIASSSARHVKEIITAKEAAEITGFTPSYMRTLAKRGQLRFQTIGSHIRFARTDVLAWLERTDETA